MELENFKKCVFNIINNSNLDIGVIYYIMKDILNEVEKEYATHLKMLSNKIEKEEK